MANAWLFPRVREEGNPYFIILKQEIKLILVYTSIAFLCTWLGFAKENYIITYLSFFRWVIEASNIPLALLFTMTLSSSEFIQNFLNYFQSFYIYKKIIKLFLFSVMRSSESQPDYFLNDLQVFLLNKFCDTSSKQILAA
jgi:hypothetical protein